MKKIIAFMLAMIMIMSFSAGIGNKSDAGDYALGATKEGKNETDVNGYKAAVMNYTAEGGGRMKLAKVNTSRKEKSKKRKSKKRKSKTGKNKKKAVTNSDINNSGNKSETFTFQSLPESLDELKELPEATLDTPFKTAALTLCALCAYAKDEEVGKEMLNLLKGPQPLSNAELQFLKERITGRTHVPFSYFAGAKPDNDYTPDEPFTLTISDNPYSYQNQNYAVMHLKSGGADSPRQIKLRKKGNQWFLWEQFVLVDIRAPKSADPWQ